VLIKGELKSSKRIKLTLTNTLGKSVIVKEVFTENDLIDEQLDLKSLSNGMYFLSIESENSNHTYKVQKVN
jgi:hypothetical protein